MFGDGEGSFPRLKKAIISPPAPPKIKPYQSTKKLFRLWHNRGDQLARDPLILRERVAELRLIPFISNKN
jgi:hypothetical protein